VIGEYLNATPAENERWLSARQVSLKGIIHCDAFFFVHPR